MQQLRPSITSHRRRHTSGTCQILNAKIEIAFHFLEFASAQVGFERARSEGMSPIDQ